MIADYATDIIFRYTGHIQMLYLSVCIFVVVEELGVNQLSDECIDMPRTSLHKITSHQGRGKRIEKLYEDTYK